jgi:dolichol-phosphate mannosyltransferase
LLLASLVTAHPTAQYLSSKPVNPTGFKIALELLLKTSVSSDQIAEVPFAFSKRVVGESKLSSKVIVRYVGQLASLYRWRYPLSFPLAFEFGMVGVLWLALMLLCGLWAERERRQTETMHRTRKRKDDV